MTTTEKTTITVSATVQAPIETVWEFFTKPEHIVNWNNASPDWHTPRATNDLREGGKFSSRMEARDGSAGFDFEGVYTRVVPHQEIAYQIADGRTVVVRFTANGDATQVDETFEAEGVHPAEMQRSGWQSILDRFKWYTEAAGKREKLRFETLIDAPAEQVYKTMLEPDTYRAWTAAFSPKSFYRGSWEKGSKILFTGEDENGKQGGMVSRIKENIPNKAVSIEHLGLLDGETEILSGPAVDSWAGALENYDFTEEDGQTLLTVTVDSNEQFKSYFVQTWPKALQRLKELCEQSLG